MFAEKDRTEGVYYSMEYTFFWREATVLCNVCLFVISVMHIFPVQWIKVLTRIGDYLLFRLSILFRSEDWIRRLNAIIQTCIL